MTAKSFIKKNLVLVVGLVLPVLLMISFMIFAALPQTFSDPPEGYQLSYEGYSRSGLFNDLFLSHDDLRQFRFEPAVDVPQFVYCCDIIGLKRGSRRCCG